jgi:hypothetical protein
MVNAAHASDSPQNAERELRIISIEDDSLKPWIDAYYGHKSAESGAKTAGECNP